MLSIRQTLCLWRLPWHRFIVVCPVGPQTDYVRCSCGLEYAINHDAGVIVPWAEVRSLLQSPIVNSLAD